MTIQHTNPNGNGLIDRMSDKEAIRFVSRVPVFFDGTTIQKVRVPEIPAGLGMYFTARTSGYAKAIKVGSVEFELGPIGKNGHPTYSDQLQVVYNRKYRVDDGVTELELKDLLPYRDDA